MPEQTVKTPHPERAGVADPRESMRVLPAFLQPVLTAMTGKPLDGQRGWKWTPMHHLASSVLSLLAGIVGSSLALAHGGGAMVGLIPGWLTTLHGMRNLRIMIFHQSAHANLFGRRRADAAIGRAISALLVVEGFDRYRHEHVAEHHSVRHMTLRDPTVQALLVGVGLRPGLSRRECWRRLIAALISPLFHLRYAAARLRSHVDGASRAECLTSVCCLTALAAALTVSHTWVAFVVVWVVPLTVLFQVSATLRLSVKHVFPAPGGDRRGRPYFANLTYAVFMGEPAPQRYGSTLERASGWTRWAARMLLIHLPARLVVLTGDTVCHDFHHRYPRADNWANYMFARRDDASRGHPGWPPYREVWGLTNAINLMFDSLSACDADEFAIAVSHSRHGTRLFEGFDD